MKLDTKATGFEHIDGHGDYCVRPAILAVAMTWTRAKLVSVVVSFYEGCAKSDKGWAKSHWRGYSKHQLAVIASSECPSLFGDIDEVAFYG